MTEDVGAVRLIFDLKELNGQRGFVIAPFRVDKSCPIVLIQSDRTGQPLPMEIVAEEEQGLQSYPEESFHTLCTGKYATCFHTFIEACVMLPLINWCFPVVSLLERIRSFPFSCFSCSLSTLYSFLYLSVLYSSDGRVAGKYSRNYIVGRKK